MAFNSIDYLIFLCVVVAILHLLPQKAKVFWILLASYFFYAQWNSHYLLLILFSTGIDFYCAKRIANTPKFSRWWLGLSLVSNLGLLFTFKYLGFFSQIAQDICQFMGRPLYLQPLELLLPVGISFYTLQTLSYTIDVHRGTIKAETSWSRFAAYVAFFPQLVAGPIEKAGHLCPQFKNIQRPSPSDLHSGCRRILWGLLKKTVIADRLSLLVEHTFIWESAPNPSSIFIAGILANVLIYADFSAYSDIAIGSARLMGIHLRENFNFPLFSRSMPDFWKRWHISLHNFFIDYVYWPLGGRKVSWSRWMLNIAAIFIISGLWHGAAWNFVVWSIYHMLLVYIHVHIAKLWNIMGWKTWKGQLWNVVSVTLVHIQRGLSMILFFIPDIHKGLGYLSRLVSEPWSFSLGIVLPYANLLNVLFFLSFVGLMLVEGLHLRRSWCDRFQNMSRLSRWTCYQLCFLCIMVFGVETNNPFIYFQF